jgi:hypothetical protein
MPKNRKSIESRKQFEVTVRDTVRLTLERWAMLRKIERYIGDNDYSELEIIDAIENFCVTCENPLNEDITDLVKLIMSYAN